MTTDVDVYISRSAAWADEIAELRTILLDAGLTETIKWGKPCYTHAGGNIVIIQEMKAFLALMFFKGALLTDPDGILVDQGPNSRSARRIEFTSVDDVRRLAETVRVLLDEALDVEESDVQVDPPPELVPVEELQHRLDADPGFRAGFESLTPGRQREYNLYFSGAKRPETRAARVDRYADRITGGKGLRD
jgi:uncharacterized protein YdeI (YjbR/CyaY-like superfamily)